MALKLKKKSFLIIFGDGKIVEEIHINRIIYVYVFVNTAKN